MFKSSAHLSLSLRPRDSGQTGYKCTVSTAAAGLGSRLQLVGAWTDSVGSTVRAHSSPSLSVTILTLSSSSDCNHPVCLISGPGSGAPANVVTTHRVPRSSSPGLCSVIVRPARRTGLDSLAASPGPGLRFNQVFMERQDV